MKKLYSFSFIFCTLFSITVFAQQNVSLKINHLLGSAPFALNQTTSNNLGNPFTITRLEYYISQVTLKHDGGQTTTVPNSYILVNANSPTTVALGSFNITTLESITFGIGVEAPINNADPNLQPTSHPLAPKSPSMHWGWSAGYRFVAIEGNTGASLNQIWQIHALGNRNYRTQIITTAGSVKNGVLEIELDADYTQALSGITVNSNLLTHGEFNEAATLLSNFRTGVFGQSAVGLFENDKLMTFDIYPNPSTGQINLKVDPTIQNANYIVLDVVGREIQTGNITGVNEQISLNEKGVYFLNLYKEGTLVGSEKVIIQ
jgi:hypothetical protein